MKTVILAKQIAVAILAAAPFIAIAKTPMPHSKYQLASRIDKFGDDTDRYVYKYNDEGQIISIANEFGTTDFNWNLWDTHKQFIVTWHPLSEDVSKRSTIFKIDDNGLASSAETTYEGTTATTYFTYTPEGNISTITSNGDKMQITYANGSASQIRVDYANENLKSAVNISYGGTILKGDIPINETLFPDSFIDSNITNAFISGVLGRLTTQLPSAATMIELDNDKIETGSLIYKWELNDDGLPISVEVTNNHGRLKGGTVLFNWKTYQKAIRHIAK